MYKVVTSLPPVCKQLHAMIFFNRNGMDTNGFLNMPAVGMNYFFKNCNLKLQAMYQYIARKGHDTQLDRDNDDLGLAVHSASILLQYTF